MRVFCALGVIVLLEFCLCVWAATTEAADKTSQAGTDAEKAWAYRSPVRPAIPATKDRAWTRNPIDAFVLAKLEEKGLRPASEAARAVLIRRLSFDLTGLPPTPEEIESFEKDSSAVAYEKVVERLLQSPRYGERWAMYWLDLVRYAESDGFKADDPRPAAWRYRDYVIASLNQDKPYDRFIREQLAGDELYPDDGEALIATGFNRHFPDEYNAVNLEQRRQEILNDMTDTTGHVFLGLTIGCARCHDHKFDPILQSDYYRIQAFFAASMPSERPAGDREEVAQYRQQMAEWETKTADVRKKLAELEEPYRRQFCAQRKVRFPKEYQQMYDTPAEKRTPLEQQIAAMVAKQVEPEKLELSKSMKPEVKEQWQELSNQMKEYARLKPPAPVAMGLTDVGPVAPATYLLKRGDWRQRGAEIAPGYLSAIEDQTVSIPRASSRTTGRRRMLAQWLTRPDHPLTARVMVNRLWQHHFGRGIVATPSDFGSQGEPPTHPELLDWLAREFVERGWSLKTMHRLMVTSTTYRQASIWNTANGKIDPENQWLWRMNRRRLEGEALRDALIAVSGQLNRQQGGPSVYPELPAEIGVARGGWPVSADPKERNRRSIYVFAKRNLRYPLFSTFDAPDGNETCACRHNTTTAPQALALLNNKVVLDLAQAFANRVLGEAGTESSRIIEMAHRIALGRPPDAQEYKALSAFLEREVVLAQKETNDKHLPNASVPGSSEDNPVLRRAVTDLCHALMNVNEFLYVD